MQLILDAPDFKSIDTSAVSVKSIEADVLQKKALETCRETQKLYCNLIEHAQAGELPSSSSMVSYLDRLEIKNQILDKIMELAKKRLNYEEIKYIGHDSNWWATIAVKGFDGLGTIAGVGSLSTDIILSTLASFQEKDDGSQAIEVPEHLVQTMIKLASVGFAALCSRVKIYIHARNKIYNLRVSHLLQILSQKGEPEKNRSLAGYIKFIAGSDQNADHKFYLIPSENRRDCLFLRNKSNSREATSITDVESQLPSADEPPSSPKSSEGEMNLGHILRELNNSYKDTLSKTNEWLIEKKRINKHISEILEFLNTMQEISENGRKLYSIYIGELETDQTCLSTLKKELKDFSDFNKLALSDKNITRCLTGAIQVLMQLSAMLMIILNEKMLKDDEEKTKIVDRLTLGVFILGVFASLVNDYNQGRLRTQEKIIRNLHQLQDLEVLRRTVKHLKATFISARTATAYFNTKATAERPKTPDDKEALRTECEILKLRGQGAYAKRLEQEASLPALQYSSGRKNRYVDLCITDSDSDDDSALEPEVEKKEYIDPGLKAYIEMKTKGVNP